MTLSLTPVGLSTFAAANSAAAEMISAAGSADSAALLAAAAVAIGPIGTGYLTAYGAAQTNNLEATRHVGEVYAGIGQATVGAKSSFVAADNG